MDAETEFPQGLSIKEALISGVLVNTDRIQLKTTEFSITSYYNKNGLIQEYAKY